MKKEEVKLSDKMFAICILIGMILMFVIPAHHKMRNKTEDNRKTIYSNRR